MKISQLLNEMSDGKMVRGMLVQTLDQFLKSNGVQPSKMEPLDEDDVEVKPIRFAPSFSAKFTRKPGPEQDTPQDQEKPYATAVSPEEIARMVHHKNSYAIYYDYKVKGSDKVFQKRLTTKPIYIPLNKIKELSDIANAYIEDKFPTASVQSKKQKAYQVLSRYLEKLAVEEAIKNSPEVQYALDKGIVIPQKLKAEQFTTTAEKARDPSIHRSSVPILDDHGEIIYDLDGLASRLSIRPEKLLKVNAKMIKSSGDTIKIASVGIPAIAGLVIDEKTKQFAVVSTCPGAGVCKTYCYAKKGGYVQYSASSESQARILNYWYNDPEGFKQQVIREVKQMSKKGEKVYLRWHDSGDFFDDAYLHLAFDVARAVPEATIYAYTKIAKVAKDPMMPENFLINFSDGAKPEETKQVNYKKTKHSIVVPEHLFKDEKTTGIGLDRLQERNSEAQQRMKKVIADKYGVDLNSVVTYDELMELPEGRQPKYNVIVVPGLDGDLGAARRDVLGSYLLEH